jgi:hypothetical protein
MCSASAAKSRLWVEAADLGESEAPVEVAGLDCPDKGVDTAAIVAAAPAVIMMPASERVKKSAA